MTLSLKSPEFEFVFGNCARVAISQAFGLNDRASVYLFDALKIDPYNGINFWECKKVIHFLSRSAQRRVTYRSNPLKVTLLQLATLIDDRKVIVVFDYHLSYINNGIIYDDYIKSLNDLDKNIPTGWWIIDNR